MVIMQHGIRSCSRDTTCTRADKQLGQRIAGMSGGTLFRIHVSQETEVEDIFVGN